MVFKERLFIALAWMPKATVQAALGGIPLAMVEANMDKNSSEYEQYRKWGMEIITCAVFSILFTAPAGLMIIQIFGPRWLNYDGQDLADPEGGDKHHNDEHDH